ncbi:MAG: hypothetical protein CVU77_00885 [Elusimicrobia bacterium HGW-Elusimicrobia-1]|jgi:hypothetical protein|nr:MAG: hypothetical protein CVU77_00885 [Elusimicrobia bacterium HGW-Elusimicrobia-1]
MFAKRLDGLKNTIDSASPRFLAAALFVVLFVPAAVTHNYTTGGGDLAVPVINTPLRILDGEMPYCDFELMFGPATVYAPALFYRIFGRSVNVQLMYAVVVNALLGVAAFALGRLIYKSNFYALLAASLIFYAGLPAHYIGYMYPHTYFLFLLAAAFFFFRHIETGLLRHAFYCGVCFSAALLFRFYETGAAILAVVPAYAASRRGKYVPNIFIAVGFFAAGMAALIAPALVLLRPALPAMVRSIVVDSVYFGASRNVSLPYFFSSMEHFGAFAGSLRGLSAFGIFPAALSAANFLTSFTVYLLPFIMLAASLRMLRAGGLKDDDRAVVWFFLGWGMFTMPKAMGRSDMDHMVFAASPLIFLAVFLLVKARPSGFPSRRFLAALVSLLLLSAPVFLAQQIYPRLTRPHYKVAARHGSLYFGSESEASDALSAIKYIEENSRTGDYIFYTYWMAPPFYALAGRKNPAYFDSILGLVFQPSREKQQSIIRTLEEKKVGIVIHFPYWGFNTRELHFLNTCRLLHEHIEKNYKPVAKYGAHWIYVPVCVKP